MRDELTSDQQIEALKKLLEKHEDKLRWSYATPNVAERVAFVLERYQDQATKSLTASMRFRDELLVHFQALTMVAEMVGNGGTHHEKNARLRGLIEMLASAVKKMREFEFKFDSYYYRWNDLFTVDYPVREYVDRIHELEREVKRLKSEVGEPVAEEQIDGPPF